MASINEARQQNLELLREARAVISEISVELYGAPQEQIESVGIGAHVRHVIEFYECFFDGLPSCRIDYDRRRRNPELERDPVAAMGRLDSILDALETLEEDQSLSVAHDRLQGDDNFADSSLLRELRHISGHAVHHFAIVGMILRLAGHPVGAGFGVAASTIIYRRQLGLGTEQ